VSLSSHQPLDADDADAQASVPAALQGTESAGDLFLRRNAATALPMREVCLHEYELVVVMNPEIPEEDVQAAIDRVTAAVTSRGGTVDDVQPWGRRKLAYAIKRHVEGNYILTNIKLDPERAHELESGFMISEDILRHLLIRKDEE
jgi:small subunit ribosomal protein S6